MAGAGDGDLVNIVVVALISFIILFIGLSVASPVIQSTDVYDEEDNGTFVENQSVRLDGAGNAVDIPGASYGNNDTVYDSTGYAIRLNGSNQSYVESDADVSISSDSTWSVSVGAAVNSSATAEELAAVSLDGRLVITYNRTASEWRAWYYDESDRASYNLSVPGANQPGSLATVQVVSNGTHVSLYRDNAASDTANVSGGSSFAAAPVNASEWYGRLDEVRTFDDNLTSSQRQTLVDDPVGPLPGTNRTSRIMFDHYKSAGSEPIFFSSASLQLYNVEYVNGYSGSQMSEGFQILGNDYAWDNQGPTIEPHEGGDLDGAPTAFVSYDRYTGGGTPQLLDGFTSALMLAGLLPTLLLLGYIISTLGVIGRAR